MLIVMGFFLCATCKTRMMNITCHLGFICVLQALKPR
jgi:hypothetical protein